MNISKSFDKMLQEIEEERMFKKKHPLKWLYRRTKWYCTGYWVKALGDFKSYFADCHGRPWYKSLWQYIYLENTIFKFFYNIYSAIDSFFFEIKRLYQWSKILWKNHDWDHGFFWPILQYKLERMEKSLGNGCTSNRKITASEIQYVLILMDKIQRYDHYEECPYKALAIKELGDPDKTGNHTKVYHKAAELYRQDIKRMFNYIADCHLGWWD